MPHFATQLEAFLPTHVRESRLQAMVRESLATDVPVVGVHQLPLWVDAVIGRAVQQLQQRSTLGTPVRQRQPGLWHRHAEPQAATEPSGGPTSPRVEVSQQPRRSPPVSPIVHRVPDGGGTMSPLPGASSPDLQEWRPQPSLPQLRAEVGAAAGEVATGATGATSPRDFSTERPRMQRLLALSTDPVGASPARPRTGASSATQTSRMAQRPDSRAGEGGHRGADQHVELHSPSVDATGADFAHRYVAHDPEECSALRWGSCLGVHCLRTHCGG